MTARVKLLELPELAQQMIGDGRCRCRAVEQLRAIGAVSPALLEALIDYLADGAALALGWPKARVSARVKILELPDSARQMIGAGVIALSAVDQLRAIGRCRPDCWMR